MSEDRGGGVGAREGKHEGEARGNESSKRADMCMRA